MISEVKRRRDVLQAIVDHQTQVCLTDIVQDYNALLLEREILRNALLHIADTAGNRGSTMAGVIHVAEVALQRMVA